MLQFLRRGQPAQPPPLNGSSRELGVIDREQEETARRLRYWEVELASHGERWQGV